MTIICSSCGSKIPFTGNVCPKCHADKGHDKKSHFLIAVIGIPLFMFGVVIGGFWGGLIELAVAGFIVHKLIGQSPQRAPAPTKDATDRKT